jgi:hypothetical protein
MYSSELGFDEESPRSIDIRARATQIFLILESELIVLQFLRWPASHSFELGHLAILAQPLCCIT